MTKCICPSCGQEIKYIPVNLRDYSGIYPAVAPVDIDETEMYTEKGRLVRGFKRHKCPPIQKQCTVHDTTTDTCHAFNGGECMNDFVCPEKK